MSEFIGQGQSQLFKYLYPDEAWRMLVTTNRPLLAMVPKGDAASASTAGTSGIVHVFNYANPQSVSQSYDAAQQQQDSLVAGQQFILQLSQFHSSIRFNAKDLRASQNARAAYMSQKKLNMDALLKQMGLEIDLALHRAGNGVIALVSSVNSGTNTLTLASGVSAQQFQKGMVLQATTSYPVDGTAPTLGAGVGTVQKVIQTVSAAGVPNIQLVLDSVSGFSSGGANGIARLGNALSISSLNAAGGILGMGNWVPSSDPASNDNFISSGLNRSNDVVRLSGVRLPTSGATIRENIQALAAVVHEFGGRPDTVLLSPIDWNRANVELQQFARYEDFKVGNVAFKALVIASPAGGELRLMSDPNQDVGVARVLTLETWKLYHMGDLIHTVDEDGLQMRRDPGSDSFKMEFRSWPQFVCYEPYANGVIAL